MTIRFLFSGLLVIAGVYITFSSIHSVFPWLSASTFAGFGSFSGGAIHAVIPEGSVPFINHLISFKEL